MADYELGVAHGRIVVDYDDRGVDQAEKSLDKLKSKSRELLGQFKTLASNWVSQARDMGRAADDFANKSENVAKTVAAISVAAAAVNGPVRNLVPGIKVLKDLKEAFGGLPDGAERFPKLIQNIIRVSAAVSLFHGATGLLARATRNIAGISTLTRGLAGLGGIINGLATPLRVVSSAFTGFLTILKGIEVVKKYAKYFELFHLATNGLAAGLQLTLPVVAQLATDIQNLLGVVALAPAALGVAGLAFATLKIGVSGMADAFKALAKGDAAALAKALKDMAPAAQEFVKSIQGLEKPFKELKLDVQQALFEGLGQKVKSVAELYLPVLQARMIDTASLFNRTGKEVLAFFDSFKRANDFGKGLDQSNVALNNMLKVVLPLVSIFYDLWRVGVDVLADITKGAGSAAQRLADMVRRARETGQLEAWMRRGVKAVGDLVKSVINFGKIFSTIFKGLGISGGNGFLDWLAKATEQFNEFLKSAQGQEILQMIGQWMQDGARHAKELADVFFKDVLPAIQAFLPFIKIMGDAVNEGLVAAIKVLAPIFKVLGEILSAMAPVLAPIVTALVFMGTVMIGLGLAAKIAAGAIAIFRTGMLLFKGLEFVVGLLGRMGGGFGLLFRALGPVLRIVKGGLIAAGLMEVAKGINEVNLKAAGGDPSKLDDMGQSLNDFVTIWDETWKSIQTGDFSWFGQQLDDIKGEWDQFVANFNSGDSAKSPVGAWFAKVKQSFETDFIAPLEQFGTRVNQALDTVFGAIGAWGTKVAQSFDRDFLGFFRELPGKIGTFISQIPSMLSTAASTLWQGFLTTVQAQFAPVIEFFSQTPYQIGFAIGSAIGEFLRIGGEIINNIRIGATTKWVEFITWVSGLPAQIGTALGEFGAFLLQKATEAWEQFKQGSVQKGDELGTWVQGLPGRIGEWLSGLGATLAENARLAWELFLAWTRHKSDEILAWVLALPGKISNALNELKGFLERKAIEAWDGFKRWVETKSNEVVSFVKGIPGRILGALGDLGSLLVDAGRSVIDGLLAGIKRGVQVMYEFVSGIAAGIAARKGPIPKDRILLIPAGVAIVQGLVRGMQQTMPQLYRQVNAINSTLGGVGGVAGSVNLSPTGAVSNVRSLASAPTLPAGLTIGGDGAAAGQSFSIGKVEIPAKDVKEMQGVADFFSAVQQKARAGRATR